MDFELPEEKKILMHTVRQFMAKECPPEYVTDIDETGEFPHEFWRKIAQLGWFGVGIPEEYGGSGGDVMDLVILVKEMAKYSMSLAVAYTLGALWGGVVILTCGTEEQKSSLLPKIARGELIFSMALTEPGGGTDLLALKSEARQDGGNLVINGQKPLSPVPAKLITSTHWCVTRQARFHYINSTENKDPDAENFALLLCRE